ncbi:hypothetical protein K469DRAFT_654490 [Zopfia rhizophila CBS 207.26]|uniref:SWR1-complex protein 3 domain-containing protein n=1 Tax=Zopfia rhizophila CBS 207.26 TaxID=1314779 RepID=A0A6A6ES24_9PEZI|nr:hypothetical protein K469DRAFT_654490 [Zopfia rhizophila CBS 207.26]
MSEPRRSTRTRAREEATATAAPVETPKETPVKTPAKTSLKRKRTTVPVKDSTPATPAAETSKEPPKNVLPVRLVEGQPLPTLPEPQPLTLSSQEYQSIQQSGVLSTSLQRSRAVWISGSNFRLFHAFFVPPKKVADRTEEDKQAMQRQKEIQRNFPLLGTGEANLIIEPHTFPIRIYAPREMVRQIQKKPQPTYGQWPNHSQYPTYQMYNNSPNPQYSKPSTPQPRPNLPKPPQQKPATHPSTPGTTTPAPDPVIHMLAQRAGTDPALKAVMKIVAAGEATKQQLEFFQGHINELTEILQKQKKAAAKAPPPPPPAPPPPPLPAPTPTPQPKPVYRPLVFEFVEGNGDKFYFPSYSFMEWLPGNQGVKLSFLITKMRTKPKEATPSTPAPKVSQTPTLNSTATPNTNGPSSNPNANVSTPAPNQAQTPAPAQFTPTPAVSPRIEDFDERNDIKDIEFYQSVTVIIATQTHDILTSLPRAIRPPDIVEKYMNEIFDTCKRAEEAYLAFRLPKEGRADGEEERKARERSDATPVVMTPVVDLVAGAWSEKKKGAGRPRKSVQGLPDLGKF